MKNDIKISNKGFTLIELMVVIAIIGILSAVMLESFSAAKSQSRDVKRISDLSNIQLALAGYFNRCGDYPATASTSATDSGCPSGITLGTYISSIPSDPTNTGLYVYSYQVDSTHQYDDYFLHATLENPNKASNNSLPSHPSSWYTPGFECGPTDTPPGTVYDYCVGPK